MPSSTPSTDLDGIGRGLEQPLGIAAVHRRRRSTATKAARARASPRSRSAASCRSAMQPQRDRLRRDRRDDADDLPRRIADAPTTIDELRSFTDPDRARARPADGPRDRRGERRPDIDHDRSRACAARPSRVTPATDDLGDGVRRRARRRSTDVDLPAGADGRARRRHRAAERRVLAAGARAARRDPDRLHRDGRDVQVAAPAAAAAGVGAVRGDRRDPAADRHRRAARRRRRSSAC